MRLGLVELQVENSQIRKIKAEKLDKNLKDSNKIWDYQNLLYISEFIKTELINRHNKNTLENYFSIKKM